MTAYNMHGKAEDYYLHKLSEDSKVQKAKRWKQLEAVWARRRMIARRRYTKMQLQANSKVL